MKRAYLISRISALLLICSAFVLSSKAQEVEQEVSLSSQELAYQALREGRNGAVEEWYRSLPRREQGQYEPLMIATVGAINSYNMELAEERLQRLERLRLRDDARIEARKQVVEHYSMVERMLSNVRAVDVLDTVVGSLEHLLGVLRAETRYLGEVRANAYITPDGLTTWRVSEDSSGVPQFEVVHKLGDGRLDEEGREVVPVRGLPEGAKLSYPYLRSDGNTLHFAVEQEGVTPANTLGGRDIYVSRYDREAGVLLVPTQMPMPFNSSADDFLYLVDEQEDEGWLLSSRGLSSGQARLYKLVPSSVRRYEGEGLDSIAALIAPQLVVRDRASAPRAVAERSEVSVLFGIEDRAISSERDLTSPQAVALLRQYLTLSNSLENELKAVEALRLRIAENPRLQREQRTREQVLTLERNIEGLRERTMAIRNELIRAEVRR